MKRGTCGFFEPPAKNSTLWFQNWNWIKIYLFYIRKKHFFLLVIGNRGTRMKLHTRHFQKLWFSWENRVWCEKASLWLFFFLFYSSSRGVVFNYDSTISRFYTRLIAWSRYLLAFILSYWSPSLFSTFEVVIYITSHYIYTRGGSVHRAKFYTD